MYTTTIHKQLHASGNKHYPRINFERVVAQNHFGFLVLQVPVDSTTLMSIKGPVNYRRVQWQIWRWQVFCGSECDIYLMLSLYSLSF